MARLTCLLLLVGMTITVSAQRAAYAPDFASVQYAGSIGFISGGIGYDLSRRTAVSIHYGYVPKNRGGELHIVAAKLLVNTWSFRISERLQASHCTQLPWQDQNRRKTVERARHQHNAERRLQA